MSRFISLWTHAEFPPDKVTLVDLEGVEVSLSARLPQDYKLAVVEFGLPRPTIALLDAICDRELDLNDVSDFFGPDEIVERTNEWRDLGLPEELVAFASDCMGNLFCFPAEPESDEAWPVFHWNHDYSEADIVASAFSDWIEDFCRLAAN